MNIRPGAGTREDAQDLMASALCMLDRVKFASEHRERDFELAEQEREALDCLDDASALMAEWNLTNPYKLIEEWEDD